MKTKKNIVKLTENELKKIISESVKKVLRESIYDANDKFTSSISTEAIPKFKHIYDLDQRNRDKVIDIIENIIYDEKGIPHVGQNEIIALGKTLNMTIDEMKKNGVFFVIESLFGEFELDGTITESVKKILKEGSKVNNKKDYFGYYGDISNPFAQQDSQIPPRKGYYNSLERIGYYDPQRSIDGIEYSDDGDFHPIENPRNEYTVAQIKHYQREENKENEKYKDYGGKNPNRDLLYKISKLGIPSKYLSKLSSKTLSIIYKDLTNIK